MYDHDTHEGEDKVSDDHQQDDGQEGQHVNISIMLTYRSAEDEKSGGRLNVSYMTLHCIGCRMGKKPMCLVQPSICKFAMVLQCTSQWLPKGYVLHCTARV